MPFKPPKTTIRWTRPAVPTKPTFKPPRDLRKTTPPRAMKRMAIPGKAGGR